LILFILSLLVASAQAKPSAEPSPTAPPRQAMDVARELQQKYDRVKDFTADFVHDYEGGVLKKKASERGTVQIRKPGMMRWDYTAPEKKEFVSDGHKIYSWIPADKQVMISSVPPDDQATTAVLFLAGKGNLTRDFTVSYSGGAPADVIALRLDPRRTQGDYDWLILVVDKRTMQIRGLTAADQQGGRSTFTFTNYRENTGLSEKVFEFKIPRGADVIYTDSAR
jgi:outer membrane lipoprotein carrier protein